MEQYVYLSIMFFSIIVFFLYIYILNEKLLEAYRRRRIRKYSDTLAPYINSIVDKIINGINIECSELENLKVICKDRNKREIIKERLLQYFENYKGEFLLKLIKLCEDIGIIYYEIENLQNTNNFKKALAAKQLGEFRSKKSIDSLLNEFKINNTDVKYNILLALSKIGDENSFIKAFENVDASLILSERCLIEIVDSFEGDKNKIYKHMINSSNNFIACVFIKSAGNYKNSSLSNEISKYLFSENKEIRIACIKAIGNIADEAYLDNMIKLLEDTEWEVRAVTARALGNFKSSKILIPLAKALSDPQWYVRFNSATSILNHNEGMSMVSYVFQGKDKFAKDIIVSAIENSPNDAFHLYEVSSDPEKKALAIKIRQYIKMRNKEDMV